MFRRVKLRLKRGLTIVLVILMVFLTVGQAFANMGDLKDKQSDIQDRLDETKKELQSTKDEAAEVKEEIRKLDEEVNSASIELQKVTDQLDQLNKDIDKTTAELEEAEENLATKNDEFNARLRTMYKNGNTGYLEVLLSASDISDLLSRNSVLKQIANSDQELIDFIKEQRDIIEDKKTELEAQRASVEVVKSDIESRKDQLETATRQKQSFMASLQEDIDAFEKEYDELTSFAKDIEAEIRKLQISQAPKPSRGSGTVTVPSSGKFAWPVPSSGRITSGYGYRIHPIFKVNKMHTGIDIAAPSGTPIVAAESGTVISTGWLGGYGLTIMVDHGGGIVTLYAHNSSVTASRGQQVARGQTIALMGSTGNSTGPHLHFEVRSNGSYVDPLPWIR